MIQVESYKIFCQEVVVCAFNLSAREVEAGLGAAWSTEQVLGQPRLTRETLSQKQNKKL